MSSTTTPNMGLIVPGVGTEPGPIWANDINASLGTLDQHNHSPGQGVQITPLGININIDLPVNGNNLTMVKTVNFLAQSAALPGTSPNLGCIYVAGNELYYNDESGNVVPITKTGSVNAGAGSITGLPSGTASVSYQSGSQTYVFQSATSTPANIDGGSFIYRNIVTNSKGLTLNPPNSMAANYSVTLPPSNPGATAFLTYDTSNNIAAGPVLVGGLTQTNMAIRATGSTVSAGGVAVSSSCGAFFDTSNSPNVPVTNLSVTITSLGNPIWVGLIADGSNNDSYIGCGPAGGTVRSAVEFQITRGGSRIANYQINNQVGSSSSVLISVPSSSLNTLDFVSAGTYTYAVNATNEGISAGQPIFANYAKLVAYEIK